LNCTSEKKRPKWETLSEKRKEKTEAEAEEAMVLARWVLSCFEKKRQ
jgi:hypothetical protein